MEIKQMFVQVYGNRVVSLMFDGQDFWYSVEDYYPGE